MSQNETKKVISINWMTPINRYRQSAPAAGRATGTSVVQTDTPAEGQWFKQIQQLPTCVAVVQTDATAEGQWFKQMQQLKVSGSYRYTRWGSVVQTDTPDESQWFRQIHQLRVSDSDRYTSWGSVGQTDTPAEGQWVRQIHQLRVSDSDRYTSWGSVGQTDTPAEGQWFLGRKGDETEVTITVTIQVTLRTPLSGTCLLKEVCRKPLFGVWIQVCKLTDCTRLFHRLGWVDA